MCDTSVAVGAATADGSVIFAKNSDRPANECQPLDYYPRQTYPAGSRLRCTHREIPQVAETLAVIGSRPYWIWGFEIGVNECGVAIGNEAVYGRGGFDDDGLIGMDYVRLGLERGKTAHEALHRMVELLEQYGQGGNCDLANPRTYHNSYLIADPTEAWVLEMVGRRWVAERVKGRRAISNCLTIGTAWDEASPDLVDHAVQQGWWPGSADFDFARAYGDPARDVRSGQCRFQRATALLASQGRLTVPDLMGVLRDHAGTAVDEQGAIVPWPICMHATPPRLGETAASLVVHLRPDQPPPLRAVAWHSFGSPCLGVFRPLFPGAGATHPALAGAGPTFTADSPWWVNERVQRRADLYPALQPAIRACWQEFEREARAVVADAEARLGGRPPAEVAVALSRLSHDLVARALEATRDLDERTARQAEALSEPPAEGLAHWTALNEPVGLRLAPRRSGAPSLR
jgi:secernin